jgi:hypothetical protein
MRGDADGIRSSAEDRDADRCLFDDMSSHDRKRFLERHVGMRGSR